MGEGVTIDRINNNGNYEPGNLRWADLHVQSANQGKRSNNTSGYTGIEKSRNRYISTIKINYKLKWIGAYHTAYDAAKARDKYIIDNKLFEYPLQTI